MRMLPEPHTNRGRIDAVAKPGASASSTIASDSAFTAQYAPSESGRSGAGLVHLDQGLAGQQRDPTATVDDPGDAHPACRCHRRTGAIHGHELLMGTIGVDVRLGRQVEDDRTVRDAVLPGGRLGQITAHRSGDVDVMVLPGPVPDRFTSTVVADEEIG